jgi:hypothetical protein
MYRFHAEERRPKMIQRILMFFALAVAGYVLRRGSVITRAGVKDLVKLNMDVLMPVLTFVTAASRLTPQMAALGKGLASPLLGLPLAAVCVIAAGALLGWLTAGLTGLRPRSRPTYIYLLAFSNSTLLPIPLSYAILGEDGILFVNLYFFGYTLLVWTVGTWMLRGRAELKYLLHPNVIALILGAVLGASGVVLPGLLVDVLKMVGASAIPLGLIYSGAVLADQRLSIAGHTRALGMMALVKLVAVPALALAVLRLAPVPEPMALQCLLQASMPCMAQAGIYVSRFGGDTSFAGKTSVVTTILCMATVPFFLGVHG